MEGRHMACMVGARAPRLQRRFRLGGSKQLVSFLPLPLVLFSGLLVSLASSMLFLWSSLSSVFDRFQGALLLARVLCTKLAPSSSFDPDSLIECLLLYTGRALMWLIAAQVRG